MSQDLHAHAGDGPECPTWCVGRADGRHDRDDVYGPFGIHHDSSLVIVQLTAGEDPVSRLYVRASRLQPVVGTPWPTLVEIDAELSPARRRSGPDSLWLDGGEAMRLANALTAAARLTATTNDR